MNNLYPKKVTDCVGKEEGERELWGWFFFDHKQQVLLAAKTTREREREKVNILLLLWAWLDWLEWILLKESQHDGSCIVSFCVPSVYGREIHSIYI